MVIDKDTVVSIEYTLKDDDGAVLDESEKGHPFDYLHGGSNVVPGLERALHGRSPGDALQISIPPGEGYGERNEELVLVVSRERFDAGVKPEPGMRFRASSPDGTQFFTIVGIEEDEVTLDGNHPLAGETLHFDLRILAVRDATREEIAHGHPHGPEGHHDA